MIFTANTSDKLIKLLIHNVQGLSFGTAQKSLRLGKVFVDGKRTKNNIEVAKGSTIELKEFQKSIPKVPELYCDDNIIIVHKPAGIECATRDKSSDNTYSLEEIFAEKNAIVVHRLDRLTDGIVILARNTEMARKFETYFRNRKIHKYYKALVDGNASNITGLHTAYLKKNAKTALVDISDTEAPEFKEIITEITSCQYINKFSLLDIILHTGRTHQIRAHLSHLEHSILGDNKYGNKNTEMPYKGYYLTAYKIEFNLEDEMKYLNDLHIEIEPSWLDKIPN